MGNLNFFDKMVSAYLKGEPIPLKGHTKITLTDVNTGEVTVTESDNIITNAVADILAHNYCGLAQFNGMFPLYKLFSGVLCFQEEITESANNYNPPCDETNPLVAHAGDTSNTTASTLRGSLNTGLTHYDDTYVKFVWDFSTNQGNGTISTVCLCPNTLGNMGLKPFDATYSPISGIGGDSNYNNSWTEEISKQYPFTISSDGQTMKTVIVSDTSFKEFTMRHDFTKFGIMRGARDWQQVGAARTAVITNVTNYCLADDSSYYYRFYASDATTLAIDKIAKSDMSVTSTSVSYSGVSLYRGSIGGPKGSMRIFPFDGTYLYFPKGTGTGGTTMGTTFYKLNITSSADWTECEGSISIDNGALSGTYVNGDQFASPIVISEDLILGNNYIINSDKVYPIKRQNSVGCSTGYFGYKNYSMLFRDGASCYYNNKHTYDDTSRTAGQGNALVKFFLSSINVLDDPVTKSSSQMMQIEYTIQEGSQS